MSLISCSDGSTPCYFQSTPSSAMILLSSISCLNCASSLFISLFTVSYFSSCFIKSIFSWFLLYYKSNWLRQSFSVYWSKCSSKMSSSFVFFFPAMFHFFFLEKAKKRKQNFCLGLIFSPGSLSLIHLSSIWPCCSPNDMGRFSLGSTSQFPGTVWLLSLEQELERWVSMICSVLWLPEQDGEEGGAGPWTISGQTPLSLGTHSLTHFNFVPSSRLGHFLGSGIPLASVKSWL